MSVDSTSRSSGTHAGAQDDGRRRSNPHMHASQRTVPNDAQRAEDVSQVRPVRALRSLVSFIVVLGGFLLIIRQPGSFWAVLGTVVGFVLLMLLSHGRRTWSRGEDRRVVLLAVALTVSSTVFLLFPVGTAIQYGAAILLAYMIALCLFVLRKPVLPAPKGLRMTLPEVFVLLTAFLGVTDIIGISLFYQSLSPSWMLLLMVGGVALLSAALGAQYFLYQGIESRRVSVYVAVLAIGMAQATWALSFWPTDAFSRAAVLFALFYVMVGVAKHSMKKLLSWRLLMEYVATSAVVLAAVLGTTQWTY